MIPEKPIRELADPFELADLLRGWNPLLQSGLVPTITIKAISTLCGQALALYSAMFCIVQCVQYVMLRGIVCNLLRRSNTICGTKHSLHADKFVS